jgi:hypothetical protein
MLVRFYPQVPEQELLMVKQSSMQWKKYCGQ